MKKGDTITSRRSFKDVFQNFQYVINNAIDDDDVKDFVMYGIRHMLSKDKNYLIGMAAGLILLMLFGNAFIRFVGFIVFITCVIIVGVDLMKFLSGEDKESFDEIKEETEIEQSSILEFVSDTINDKKK